MAHCSYYVGIDVGSYSVGLAAIAIDEDGRPTKILSAVSQIHDSGLDPDKIKSAVTRLASSGVARRTRRLYRRKRRRLVALDKFLEDQGWPVESLDEYSDPFLPWKVRAELAAGYIDDVQDRTTKLSIALRHIARHRGWRNPYTTVKSLYQPEPPSEAFQAVREEISKAIGRSIPESATVGQMVAATSLGKHKLRGEGGMLSARLRQSDHAREIIEIARMQRLSADLTRQIIDVVFAAESPKGSAASRVGSDPLQPGEKRALKATDAFQRYRVAALIGNLRVREASGKRELTIEERRLIFDHLINLKPKEDSTWKKVADILGVDRGRLSGTAELTDDGERAGARPPVHETNRVLLTSPIKSLSAWWSKATPEHQRAMVQALSNSEAVQFDTEAGAAVQVFFVDLDEEEHAKLDRIHLPIGRAAYSENTLLRLTNRMISDGVDLYTARLREFGVAPDWTPPAPAIGERVGNPAVDRTLKIVARWLDGVTREWGAPERVTIEHVRAAFASEALSREIDRDMRKRGDRNVKLFEEMQERFGISGKHRRADLWRYQSVQRQNCQCAYCGGPITYSTAEMDHIVPQAGPGSTNTRDNLVAVCGRCNRSKSNIPFAVWAHACGIEGVSVAEAVARTKFWIPDSGMRATDFKKFVTRVSDRLKRSDIDEQIDSRSLESVAWMANELRSRISQRFAADGTRVGVYKGALTSEARRAAGIADRLQFIDGAGKSRLDRRHHAVDAAVVAFTSNYVAEVLAQRSNLRFSQELQKQAPQWKEFTGADAAHRSEWTRWKSRMQTLAELLNTALAEDRIVVMTNLRLRLGNGEAHEATISPLDRTSVGSAMSLVQIDRASSEALWCALTRHPDFDSLEGLPENPSRTIRVHGTTLGANDTIDLFGVDAASIKVRGGSAELGNSFHHARIYKVPAGRKHVFTMMRVYNHDLQRHRNVDLFSVDLAPQTMSVRKCEPKLRKSLSDGTAEYLGWIVVDDELVVDTSGFNKGQIVGAQEAAGGAISRWRVDGFYDVSTLRLRPLQMSAEGLTEGAPEDLRKIVDTPGWRPAVNKLFESGNVTVIRRDALGRVRLSSAANLPTTWTVR